MFLSRSEAELSLLAFERCVFLFLFFRFFLAPTNWERKRETKRRRRRKKRMRMSERDVVDFFTAGDRDGKNCQPICYHKEGEKGTMAQEKWEFSDREIVIVPTWPNTVQNTPLYRTNRLHNSYRGSTVSSADTPSLPSLSSQAKRLQIQPAKTKRRRLAPVTLSSPFSSFFYYPTNIAEISTR